MFLCHAYNNFIFQTKQYCKKIYLILKKKLKFFKYHVHSALTSKSVFIYFNLQKFKVNKNEFVSFLNIT